MPYVNKPRPYKKEYQQQKERNEHERRMKRQKNRRDLDKKGVNRKGKDIDHKKPLSRGGSNSPKNLRLISSKKNRKFKRRSDHKPA
jgi:5-methylcytosine-specific restriction endonuclease McrA|tara:strand:+ start:8163 stop:8420 length:258 start_codon:yes stop_codon:yes gene_type:complete